MPGQEAKDITFHYNANFFLFATLELARPIAHGRVQTPATTSTPVLTGMPVSGMAYLDRPSEAGYFLFPDLSVRHEGLYRLSFNLYEETKEEKDLDEETSNSKQSPVGASFDWRMEIKSVNFSVYSAKKFPGLAESTTLSRTVAEQGCRVRIRRDVRMRRRDGKPSNNDYKKVEDDYCHKPTARTPERQMHDYRQRSASAASDHSRMGYADSQRRPSVPEYPAAPPPPPGYSQNVGGQHLMFGGAGPRPPQQYPGPQPPQPMSSPVTAYPSSAHASPYQTPAAPPYGYSSRPSSQAYGSAKGEYEERRYSNASYVPPSPQYNPSIATNGDKRMEVDTATERRLSQSHPSGSLPPVLHQETKNGSHPDAEKRRTLPSIDALMNPAESTPRTAYTSISDTQTIAVDTNPYPAQHPYANVATGSKRRHVDASGEERLSNGARPSDSDDRRMCRLPDGTTAITYSGLKFEDAGGITKFMAENTFYA